MSLQLALTQLESLAAMLNERKRESEQYQAFRETIKSIGGGKFVLLRSIVDDPSRILLRQDLVTQLEFDNYGSTVGKQKTRKLLLLNDMLICTTVSGESAMLKSIHCILQSIQIIYRIYQEHCLTNFFFFACRLRSRNCNLPLIRPFSKRKL